VTCRGGNGIAVGSLGQYGGYNLVCTPDSGTAIMTLITPQSDNVQNLLMEDLSMIRLPASVQPNMQNGVRSLPRTIHRSSREAGVPQDVDWYR
jgi:galacturan 1,4-alpha-galacturonidase